MDFSYKGKKVNAIKIKLMHNYKAHHHTVSWDRHGGPCSPGSPRKLMLAARGPLGVTHSPSVPVPIPVEASLSGKPTGSSGGGGSSSSVGLR